MLDKEIELSRDDLNSLYMSDNELGVCTYSAPSLIL